MKNLLITLAVCLFPVLALAHQGEFQGMEATFRNFLTFSVIGMAGCVIAIFLHMKEHQVIGAIIMSVATLLMIPLYGHAPAGLIIVLLISATIYCGIVVIALMAADYEIWSPPSYYLGIVFVFLILAIIILQFILSE